MTKSLRFPLCFAGMFVFALVLLAPRPLEAGSSKVSYKVLYSFQGQPDGARPYASLIMGASGNLYGTTAYGGTGTCSFDYPGCGTVFAVGSSGQEAVLYSFAGPPTDGEVPTEALVQDSSGNFYGVTFQGGVYDHGTVFKMDTSGMETVLYSFCPGGGQCTDGADPNSPLILDANGSLYGTTYVGGASYYGTVFKVDPDGTETVLYSFTGESKGGNSYGGLIFDVAGSLYGTTVYGGKYGWGTVFKLTPQSDGTWTPTVLHSFKGTPDGRYPYGGLIWDAKGNLYGTTSNGGTKHRYCNGDGCGTVFKLAPTGKETVLYRFSGRAEPAGTLVRDSAGNLYGTTGGDGAYADGTVFRLSATGKETVLYSFRGRSHTATLVRDAAGNFYGTTALGGSSDACQGSNGGTGCGTVFKLTP